MITVKGVIILRVKEAWVINGVYISFIDSGCLTLQGVPYVIYWKNTFSRHAACHFRHALLSVVKRYIVLSTCLDKLTFTMLWVKKEVSVFDYFQLL